MAWLVRNFIQERGPVEAGAAIFGEQLKIAIHFEKRFAIEKTFAFLRRKLRLLRIVKCGLLGNLGRGFSQVRSGNFQNCKVAALVVIVPEIAYVEIAGII